TAIPRLPWNCLRASTACAQATARRMRLYAAHRASRRACSNCSRVRTGRCWLTRRGSAHWLPAQGCACAMSALTATRSTHGAMSRTHTAWRLAIVCWCGLTATWGPSPMPAALPSSKLTCAAWPCRRPLPAQTKTHARVPNMTACMQAGEHRPGHKAIPWRTVAIVGFIVCMYGAGMAAVLPVLPFYVREMGGSALILGVVFAIEALSQFVFAPRIGQLSDRDGRKRVLLATQVVAAASLLSLAAAPGLLCVLLARALFGTAAGNLSAAAAYVAERSHPDHRRQAIGILTGSVGLGGIVGAGLSGLLSDVSLNAPIYAALVLTLLALCAATYGLDDGHAAPAEPGQAHRAGGSIASVLRAPAIRILLAVMMCHFFAFGMYTSQVPVFLADRFV